MFANVDMKIETYKSCLWFPDQKILVDFDITSKNPGSLDWKYLTLKSQLVYDASLCFGTHLGLPYTFSVTKMKKLYLQDYKSLLDEILGDYEFVQDGWKGGIKLSNEYYVWLQLMTQ